MRSPATLCTKLRMSITCWPIGPRTSQNGIDPDERFWVELKLKLNRIQMTEALLVPRTSMCSTNVNRVRRGPNDSAIMPLGRLNARTVPGCSGNSSGSSIDVHNCVFFFLFD